MGATATLTGRMAWDDSAFKRGLKSSEDRARVFANKIKTIIGAIAIGTAVKKAFSAGAEFETLTAQFKTLLGSTEQAKKRMDELAKFASNTPFELPGLAQASRILESMAGDSLSTGQGLRLVGDVASAANQPIEEIAVHAGRLYAALQGGRAAGEALARLQELGILSIDARNKIEALQKEGKKGEEVWRIAANEFERFSGSMEEQSRTMSGKLSTLRDNIKSVFRAFVAGNAMEGGKDLIDSLNKAAQNLIPAAKAFGEILTASLNKFNSIAGPLIDKASSFANMNKSIGVYNRALGEGKSKEEARQIMIEDFKRREIERKKNDPATMIGIGLMGRNKGLPLSPEVAQARDKKRRMDEESLARWENMQKREQLFKRIDSALIEGSPSSAMKNDWAVFGEIKDNTSRTTDLLERTLTLTPIN